MKTPLLAFATTAALMAGTPALAQQSGQDLVVSYADLDLSTKAGQRTLDKRIDAAAKKFCGVGEQTTGTRLRSPMATKCYREAKRLATQEFAAIVADAGRGG